MDKIPLSSDFDLDDYVKAQMYNDRVLMLCGDVDEYYAGKIESRMHTLSESKEDIQIFITSFGGELYPTIAIVRAIRQAQLKGCTIIGEVRGYAMSAAAIILQACDMRFASLEDVVMVHGVTSVAEGSIRNQEADVNMAKKLMDVHADLLSGRNTSDDGKYHDFKYWRKLLDDNYPHYYFGEEARKIGLIDEVIS